MDILFLLGALCIILSALYLKFFKRQHSKRKHFRTYGPHKERRSIVSQYNIETIGDMFYKRVKINPEAPAYYEKEKEGERKEWECTTWGKFFESSSRVANYLVNHVNLPRGSKVCILGPTKAKWAVTDMGVMLSACITVGLYPHQTSDQYKYIISDSEADIVFVDGEDETRKIIEATKDLKHVKAIVVWDDELSTKPEFSGKVQGWQTTQGELLDDVILQERITLQDPAEVAVLVYTSGTTGPPKGVMISHRNILALAKLLVPLVTFYEDDLSFNFLPLAHVAEKLLGFYPRIDGGIVNCFASSVAQVIPELQEVSPTIFGSVPRIFEKAYSKIYSDVSKKPKLVQAMFHWATEVASERLHKVLSEQPISLSLRIKYYFAYKIFTPVRQAFGGRLRQMAVGAAPIDPKILEFFWGCGLKIYEVYGMTEMTVVSHINCEKHLKLGTVGKLVGGECKIAEDGEILVRGPFVFEGYYKNPTATAETKDKDGWLHTGDIGQIDNEGFLKITDRKKHLIITSGGKNLSPANIENSIKNQDPIISQIHAHGDKRPFVVAIITPSPLDTLEWGVTKKLVEPTEYKYLEKELMGNPYLRSQRLNVQTAKVTNHPEYVTRVRYAVEKGNQLLSQVEKVKKFFILDRDFSQENGELTPTMKMKRREIETKFADTFDKLYSVNSFGYNVEQSREAE